MNFTHLVTLINRRTENEVSFEVATSTDRFSEVIREISHQKAVRGLKGYELFEAIPLNAPCPF